MKVRMEEFSFPEKTGMAFFQELLSNRQLFEIVKHFAHKDKRERMIEMPSSHQKIEGI